ncbi:MAG: aspartate carbamoyltransferase regulatory subunit [archaeon]
MSKELSITGIGNGTAIDHIPVGRALRLVELLGVDEEHIVGIALNVKSKRLGKKDLMFIENKYLSGQEIAKTSLVARKATINLIKDFKVEKKIHLQWPDKVIGLLKCANPNCISNHEIFQTRFEIDKEKETAKCFHCETIMDKQEIMRLVE